MDSHWWFLRVFSVDEVGLDFGEEGVQGVEGVDFPQLLEEEIEDCAAHDGGGTVDGSSFYLVEGQDEGGVFLRGNEVFDHEGENGDDGLVWEAGLGVELDEGEEGYLARSCLCVSVPGLLLQALGYELTEVARHEGSTDRTPGRCLWRSSELIAYFDMGLEIWRFRDPDISIARVVAVRLWVRLAGL